MPALHSNSDDQKRFTELRGEARDAISVQFFLELIPYGNKHSECKKPTYARGLQLPTKIITMEDVDRNPAGPLAPLPVCG